eukprot:SAG31_NODE_627_length_13445_cov_18.311053_3_plen_97_part_00
MREFKKQEPLSVSEACAVLLLTTEPNSNCMHTKYLIWLGTVCVSVCVCVLRIYIGQIIVQLDLHHTLRLFGHPLLVGLNSRRHLVTTEKTGLLDGS